MDGDAGLSLADLGDELEDFPFGDRAVGLDDDFFLVLRDTLGDLGGGLVVVDDLARFAIAEQELRLCARRVGLEQGQERRRVFLDPDPSMRPGDLDLGVAGKLDREEHERHELKDDVDHRSHVDMLVAFFADLAAEQHGNFCGNGSPLSKSECFRGLHCWEVRVKAADSTILSCRLFGTGGKRRLPGETD